MDSIPVLIAYWMFSDKPCCPACHGCHVMKNGFTRHGDQNHMCREYGRQFVENPKQNSISTESAIGQLAKKAEKQTTSSALTIRCDSVFLAWFG